MTAHFAKPPMKSAVLFGWEDRNGLVPVYFKGQMSSDFLQDLICICKGKSVCMKGCICFEQSPSCTDLCPCQAGDLCRHENTHLAISRNTAEDDAGVDYRGGWVQAHPPPKIGKKYFRASLGNWNKYDFLA